MMSRPPSHPRQRRARPRRNRRRLRGALAVLVALAWSSATAAAVEQADQFVGQLRERGQYDLALDYLDRLEQSPLADDATRAQIPYLRAVTQMDQARQALHSDERAKLMDAARSALEQYATAHPNSSTGAEARLQLATLLFDEGQRTSTQASQLPAGPAYAVQGESLHRQARGLLGAARQQFAQAEAFYAAELERQTENADADPADDATNGPQEVRGRVAQLGVLAAQALFEQGLTYPPVSADYTRLVQQAAGELNKLHKQYSRWLVGYYALLHEGRCYQALGDYQRAQDCYQEILSQQSVLPAFRKLIAAAFRYQAECLLAEDKYDAAIQSCRAWLKDARDDEADQPEWLAVRWRLAEAMQQQGRSLRDGSVEARRVLADARDEYRRVAAAPGEFQAQARSAAAELSHSDRSRDERVHTFDQAYQLGREAMASISAAKIALPTAEKNNPAAVEELRAQMQQGKDDARRYLRLATTLVDDQTDLTTLNNVRYYLCWLYWENGDYYQAAVLGEFLARRYPDHPAAAAAAKIAMASYERLYNRAISAGAGPADVSFEARRMAEMAEFLTRRWPGTEAANAAFSVLAGYAIRSGQIDEARQLLDRVPEDYRPRLELQLGNAMWGQYLDLLRRGGPPADEAARDRLRSDAVKYLNSGFRVARTSGNVDETTAMAALYLVQSMLEDGRYAEAIRLLNAPQVGPLTLVTEGSATASRPAYAIEAYKAALRAYVSVTPPQVDKAIEAIHSLERVAQAGGGHSDQQLTQMYVGLSLVLKQQIGQLRDAGREAEAARVSQAFAKLLDRIATREAGGSPAMRLWLAQTYYTTGRSLSDRRAAAPFYTKASNAFRQLAAEAEANPDVLPAGQSLLAVRSQLGDCLRELGKYQEALDTFSDILKEQENQLAVQIAAAETYEARGVAEKDPRWFERAIYGGYKLRSTGKNRLWGWLKIALVAERAGRSDPRYQDAFFQARLGAARCRFLAGAALGGAERAKDLATAKESIQSVYRLYPDMGGSEWRGKFDQLLKQIQEASGEQPVGLREFDNKP